MAAGVRRLLLVGLAAAVAAMGCRGAGPPGEAGSAPPAEAGGAAAASAFLSSLGRLAAGGQVEAAAPELAASLARAAREAAAPLRLEVEVRPLGGPRFVQGGGEWLTMGMVAALRMRELGPDGAVRRELAVPRYDFVLVLERRGQGWAVVHASPLPWLGDGRPLEGGGCPLLQMDNHLFGRLQEARRPDVPQMAVTPAEMEAIERAWRCYWLVTSYAFSRLDDGLLPQVSGGGQLQADLEMVRARRLQGVALEEEAVHRSPVLVQYTGDRATVDEWFDGRGRGVRADGGEPLADWEYKAGHITFALEKRDGRWLVVMHAFVVGPEQGGAEGG